MKGLVFVEFMDMVEEKFSPKILQSIIDAANLPSGCAYTSIGTYHHSEIVTLVGCLSEETKIPVSQLLQTFGQVMFKKLATSYSEFFTGVPDAFSFVERVDGYVHLEVRKLYPDAELPRFECVRTRPDALQLTYKSARPMADLAHGMLQGCIDHYRENIVIERQDDVQNVGMAAVFLLRRT